MEHIMFLIVQYPMHWNMLTLELGMECIFFLHRYKLDYIQEYNDIININYIWYMTTFALRQNIALRQVSLFAIFTKRENVV